ncbi:hypothetical protein DCAR_0312041 [Daucus carota subsp. sativus]|uniref:EF-hand domain-containing protein n=1 Tax=Daucus carota subsp. sativus TaxID=79200 RepID=A0A161WT48_DAUCS|nr:PREDICTED: reticulocalbin-2 [Daucus carota subsp. sativus]WOG92765.1 hypothetical protein DCAR_0312041 [Daucus carota subsp. sativus]
MGQTVVVVTTVYLVLATTLYQVMRNSDNQYNSISAARRLGYNISPPNFDPLVESIQRSVDDNTAEKLQNDSSYLDDDGKINTTYRIMVLFPFLDVAPKDGFVDSKELEKWILQQAVDRLNFGTRQALELHDENGDGLVSFPEYLPHVSNQDLEGDDKRRGAAGWWYEQFKNADADHNGLLDFDELKDFLHPEDSTNERIQKWLLRDEIREMDYDNNQKLDWMEFETGAYDGYLNYIALEAKGDKDVPSEQDVFAKLDLDQDELLDLDELRPFLQYMNPGVLQNARHHTLHLIDEADQDEDGKLTIQEMINNDRVFYDSLFHQTNVSDDKFHDEL